MANGFSSHSWPHAVLAVQSVVVLQSHSWTRENVPRKERALLPIWTGRRCSVVVGRRLAPAAAAMKTSCCRWPQASTSGHIVLTPRGGARLAPVVVVGRGPAPAVVVGQLGAAHPITGCGTVAGQDVVPWRFEHIHPLTGARQQRGEFTVSPWLSNPCLSIGAHLGGAHVLRLFV